MREYRLGRLKGRWVVIWNDDGRRRRFRLEAHTEKEAEREARDLILSQTAPARGVTVDQLWSAYTEEMEGRRQAAKLTQTGRNVLPTFGHLSASQITIDDCRTYITNRRVAGRKDATIRTELGCLRTCLKWAHRAKLIAAAPHIEMPQTPPPRERYLTRAEVEKLLAAAGEPHIRLAMLLMLTTAGRIGALLELTWNRVDLDRRMIKLATTDIGPRKGRATVPINDTLMAALSVAREAARSDFVIEWGGRRVGSIKTGFNAAVERAGIEHCTPHDLRRTAGRFMAEAGVPIEEIAEYLGHSNPNITRSTYARFSPDYLRRAAGSLEFGGPELVQRTENKTP
ncbi:site-specific recombinase XerD [Salipiger profundus]|jgi:integrase|uniref:Site-specific recombinase XerD n=1 Tax=Salipiger profundus TaxID=1229727 RepID=A0A1U7D4T1_9RHOB|nr:MULTISPECIES: site-specific integrase [Salipiger]APX23174.1 site-specific recombinase XerD [Salipiger profundus]SFD16745.1 Site-specific recombinase XerD [Salipiger profundus]